MLDFSNSLTSISHTCQLTSKTVLAMLCSDLCYTVKNTKEYTRIFYMIIGTNFHYLLNSEWFRSQVSLLSNVAVVETMDKPYILRKYLK